MRKYEQGGGVVRCEWKKGSPWGEYGTILVESWTLSFDWNGRPQVKAQVSVRKWNLAAETWHTMNGELPPVGEKIRRWMRVGMSNTAPLSLTVENW